MESTLIYARGAGGNYLTPVDFLDFSGFFRISWIFLDFYQIFNHEISATKKSFFMKFFVRVIKILKISEDSINGSI